VRISNYKLRKLLAKCLRMFIDVTETIADTAALEINDLDTLGFLIADANTDVLAPRLAYSTMLMGCLLPGLKELSISLKLPLAIYEALDSTETSSHPELSLLSAWTALPLAIKQFLKLKRLQIWLDHEGPCS
jgi:hypothetical protein